MGFSEIDRVIRWYPTDFGQLQEYDLWHDIPMDMYVHIPFCKGKCGFCPFNSVPINRENLDDYFNHLTAEIRMYADKGYYNDRPINALWIGGGTPSAVPFSYIENILELVSTELKFCEDAEITLETNLHDLDDCYLDTITQSNINRISVGVQSFLDKYLRMMGRTYKAADVFSFLDRVQKYHLNVSLDVMYRYPGQTVEDLQMEIDSISSVTNSFHHITLYSLMLFPRLPIYNRVINGLLPKQPSLKVYEEMNGMLHDQLPKLGFKQYTSYHFAKAGYENKYNVDRWRFPQRECLACGPGAFGQTNGFVYCNQHSIHEYKHLIDQGMLPIQEGKHITPYEMISRYLVLGTKCLDLDLKLFERIAGVNALKLYASEIDSLVHLGLIKIENDRMLVTKKGAAYIIDVNNAFITENNRGYTQPQYRILDMYNGGVDAFNYRTIEE